MLKAGGAPLTGLSASESQEPITSYGVSKTGSDFLLAYYHDLGSTLLPPQLNILRFRNSARRYDRVVLRGEEMSPTDVMTRMPLSCIGSVLDVEDRNSWIVIDTHLTPSASCMLVLDRNLRFRAAVPGILRAAGHGAFFLAGNTGHFYPTHREKALIFDPRTLRLSVLYPDGEDERQRAFSTLLKQHLDPSWCREFNKPCDPVEFSFGPENIRFDNSQNVFLFDVVFGAEGFGDETAAAVPAQTFHYEARYRDGKWVSVPKNR